MNLEPEEKVFDFSETDNQKKSEDKKDDKKEEKDVEDC